MELNEFNQIQPSGYHMEISKLMNKSIPQNIPNNQNLGINNIQNPNLISYIQKDQLKIIFSPGNNNGNNHAHMNSSNNINLISTNQIKNSNESNLNIGMENPIENKKKKINPILLDDNKNGNCANYPINYSNSNGGNMVFGNYMSDINMHNSMNDQGFTNFSMIGEKHLQEKDNCDMCKILRFDSIQTKEVNIKLELADDFSASFVWENKVNLYYSYIKLVINDKILFYNHLNGKFIKHFVCNNFVYVYYDTNNLIHISSLLNTNVITILFYLF